MPNFVQDFDRQPRQTLIIGHPHMGRGGSESNVMWLIEALKGDCDITVMTTGGWDLAELNAFYGTQVQEHEVKVRIAPVPWPARRYSAAALRGSCYQRFARQIAGEYDLRISAYNPTDWGLPAIHFIADFTWQPEIRRRFDPLAPGFVYRDSWLRRAYLRLAAAVASPSGRDVLGEDVVIANSRWSAERFRQACGAACAEVIYPPVWAEFPAVPWEDKEEAFVMIGRISPEKRIEEAIAILHAVREKGHSIRLHLCGAIGSDAYGRSIDALCKKYRDWIVPQGRVSGPRKASLLAACRYGIQTRAAEPFGISVAEMVKAGAIVFAPGEGGQAEIVDHPELLFGDRDQAVEKICAVLRAPSRQANLRSHLAAQAPSFSAQRFVREIRALLGSQRCTVPEAAAPAAAVR